MLINSNNSIQPPYGTVESARRKCSLRYSYVALVSDQEFCSFEEEPEMALVIGQEFCSFEEEPEMALVIGQEFCSFEELSEC